MIVLRGEILSGSFHASDHTLRSPEWPPHPDRVFQALVAAMHGGGNDPLDRAILEAIEGAPWRVNASEALSRPPMTQYVPRNEDQGGGSGSYNPAFSTARNKERRLPVCEPVEPVVHYYIDAAVDVEHFQSLLSRVARLGRSQSVLSVVSEFPQPNWEPSDVNGELSLRVPFEGRLAELEAAFQEGRRASFRWGRYRRCGSQSVLQSPRGHFSQLFILAASSRGVDGKRIAPLVEEARRRILAACEDPLPEWLSGHSADGSPLQDSHLGIAPAVFTGRHGDGRIMGLGLLVPARIEDDEVRQTLSPVLGSGLEIAGQTWTLENSRSITTESSTWTVASRCWATATPMEIRRRDRRSAVTIAAEWADRCGLPAPISAEFRPEPFLIGAGHAGGYAQGKRPRLRMHAKMEWETPIAGPVALGMGRHRGFGLMRPFNGSQTTDVTKQAGIS